ncbi:Cytochrome c oxidase polypeptide VIII,mitochondrial [Wickerhamomyces ciferrii]|uniref:Cytochrome c oxidase subunit 8, mitochondrial n=1 Tax=Wickerhamomyces ciferrii (strain ATCC 14091 / BCRC 22168 / CBS 111 / JCM 3599 / NBRC 0793 / NRRL Y-1031 F-60-10) TaxID=1206466 RepID=K0KPD2_WICCF|nr:Cytochrome c oxidase polypeptide VIII,mitochondrial [Wickerhamomyces ciferrii]CCH44806.1 Cytochrome c oxidase polypeptide VIII,mitochondrial [Wickerhamomyces ciferrii]
MFARQLLRNQVKPMARRAFHTSKSQAVHFEEGVYTNIPFKVHNRKIPYAIVHFSFFGLGFAIPFVAVYVQLKRSGSI